MIDVLGPEKRRRRTTQEYASAVMVAVPGVVLSHVVVVRPCASVVPCVCQRLPLSTCQSSALAGGSLFSTNTESAVVTGNVRVSNGDFLQ